MPALIIGIILIVISIITVGVCIYCFNRIHKFNEDVDNANKKIKEENEKLLLNNNHLRARQTELTTDNYILEKEKNTLLQENERIRYLNNDKENILSKAFEQYCDLLEKEYKEKEQEYDKLCDKLGEVFEVSRLKEMEKTRAAALKLQEELKEEKAVLEKIRASRIAVIEAQKREEEIRNKANFYSLQISEADKHDIAYLKSIEFNLREARPLRMLIWTTFYRDKLTELVNRVGANGAIGIYKITHIETGLAYIGQAKDIKTRWAEHVKCSLGIDTPVTSSFYAFTRDKGIENFTFEILEKCSITELNEKEKFYIDLYQTYEAGLNSNRGNK